MLGLVLETKNFIITFIQVHYSLNESKTTPFFIWLTQISTCTVEKVLLSYNKLLLNTNVEGLRKKIIKILLLINLFGISQKILFLKWFICLISCKLKNSLDKKVSFCLVSLIKISLIGFNLYYV